MDRSQMSHYSSVKANLKMSFNAESGIAGGRGEVSMR